MVSDFREFYETIVEDSTNGILVVDQAGVISYANSALHEMFGYSGDELLGNALEVLLPEPQRGKHVGFRETFFRAPSKRKMGGNDVLFGRKKSGEEFPVNVGLMHGTADGQRFAYAVVIDITDRWIKDQELEIYRRNLEEIVRERTEDLDLALRASQANSRFLIEIMNSMSHEFRTPLNAVIGFSELLTLMEDSGGAKDSAVSRYAELIREAGGDLLALATKATQMSILSTGAPQANLETLKLDELVESALQKTKRYFEQTRTTVLFGDGMDAMVVGDRVMLLRVLSLVLENSAKYGGEKAQVHISTKIENGRCRIFIQDNGNGVLAEHRKLAFEPFQRLGLEGGTVSGMGLGLTLARSYMSCMDGQIELENSASSGACIVLDLAAKSD